VTIQAQLAGRRRERQVVSDVLTGASGASALVVAGEAGIGKSRLVAWAAEAAMEQQRTVLTGWCLSLSEDLPFLPVVDVLRTLAERDDGRLLKSVLAACPGYVRREIGRLLPEVEDSDEQASPPEEGGSWHRQRLFGAVRAVLVALAEATPSAVVIEDVHWADPSTRDLLGYLLAPSHRTGLPMVLISRGEESDTGWLQDLLRHGQLEWLSVQPLTRAETAEQIELLRGSVPAELVGDIYGRSQGNPFFTEQLVAAGARPAALPATLHALLLQRLSQATEVGLDVVAALAIARRPLDEAALCSLTGRPAGEIAQAVRDLSAGRLLLRGDGGGRQLRHVLLAEAACGEMTAAELQDWHRRVGKHLAALNESSLAHEVAEHYAAAGLHAEELGWRSRGAQYAESVYAPAQAAHDWQRVIALWNPVEQPEAVVGIDLAEVYFHASTALENAGDGPAAGRLAEEALSRLVDEADDATKVRLYYRAGFWRSVTSLQEGADLLEQAIEIGAQLAPTRDYVRALHKLAGVRNAEQSGNYVLQTELMTRALRAAQDAGLRSEQKLLTAALAALAKSRDDKEGALAGADRALAVLVEPPDPIVDAVAAVYVTDILLKYGDLPRAVDIGRAALEDARHHGYPQAFASCVLFSNVIEALRELGSIDAALAEIEDAGLELAGPGSVVAYSEIAAMDCVVGRLEQASAFWDDNDAAIRAFAGLEFPRDFALLRCELWLWLERAAEALADALRVLEPLSATEESQMSGGLFVLALRACADLAQLGRARGDDAMVSSALENARRLVELRDRCLCAPFAGSGGLPVTKGADAATWTAEWSRLGDSDPAMWETAAQAWSDLGRPHRAGYARWRQADALLMSPKGRAAAEPVLRLAAELARTHVPLSRAIADLAQRARIGLVEPLVEPAGPQPVTTGFGLTERELAVLALVGQGRTNAEIGAKLFISRKTASVHVTNILRKLGVGSRVQAAAMAAHAGLIRASETKDS
jgi:DNA-binding CsgD family transcriptional regulator